MTPAWFDPLLFSIASFGGGGLLISLWVGFAPSERTRGTLAAQFALALLAIVAAAFSLLSWFAGQPLGIWAPGGAVAVLYVLVVLIPSVGFARCAGSVGSALRSKRGRFVAMLSLWVLCPFLALQFVFEEMTPAPMITEDELTLFFVAREDTFRPKPSPTSPLTTDKGRTVGTLIGPDADPTPEVLAMQARALARSKLAGEVIALPLGWQNCNCHGFVFGGAKFWIGGTEVDKILEDNGYQVVDPPRPDDIAIYRDKAGAVMHSAIVRGQSGDGVILVESKWGAMGRFIHPHDRHIYPTTVCTFYRSTRPGHLLRGADAPRVEAPVAKAVKAAKIPRKPGTAD